MLVRDVSRAVHTVQTAQSGIERYGREGSQQQIPY